MIVVEHGLHLHTGRVGERLIAVEAILIDGDVVVECQFEDVGEQVDLTVHRLYGVVESAIGILVEVYLAIDVATPYHILRHIDSCGEHQTGTHRHALTLLGLLLTCFLASSLLRLLLLLTASLGLSKRFASE